MGTAQTHIYPFFPSGNFAQAEFEDCAHNQVRNKISPYPAIKSEQQQRGTEMLAMSTACVEIKRVAHA